jgi:transposase InsO family protein
MSKRFEFVVLAVQKGIHFRELCCRFGISRKTGYKWVARYRAEGATGLKDRCRRPHCSPRQCPQTMVQKVVQLRHLEPTWSGYKLRRRLQDLGHAEVPAASTCTEIVRRAGLIERAQPRGPLRRFERAWPNELWQADFKGDFATQSRTRCYPLTMLDDHSRFNLLLAASGDQTTNTVKALFTEAFHHYGLPETILCDNGSPWGGAAPGTRHTRLTVWLLRLGVRVIHGRPYHPQTQGKEERFHRTLNDELLRRHTWSDLAHCAREFAGYRERYNCERPHRALQGDTPITHYRPSVRAMPEALLPIEYPSGLEVRVVRAKGVITFRNQTWQVGEAFASLPIGLRPSPQADGQWEVFFCQHLLGLLDLTLPTTTKHAHRPLKLVSSHPNQPVPNG